MSEATITSLEVVPLSHTSLTLTWSGTYDTVTIKKAIESTSYSTVATDISDSFYTVTGLAENTLYFFTVTPTYDSAAGTAQQVVYTTTYTPKITAISYKTPTSTSIPVYWTGNYYKVAVLYKKSVDVSADYITFSTPTGSPNATITNLATDTTYDICVKPYDMDNSAGAVSDIISVTTDYIPVINSLTLGDITSSTAEITVDGSFDYVAIQTSNTGKTYNSDSLVEIADGSATTITITNLSPYTTYFIRAIPYTKNYNPGSVSTAVKTETLFGYTEFAAGTITNNTAVLTWSGSYFYMDIYYKKSTASSYNVISQLSSSDAAEYTLTGLTKKTTYTAYLLPYNITVDDEVVYGTSSEIITFTTDFSAAINIVKSYVGITDICFSLGITGILPPYYNQVAVAVSGDIVDVITDTPPTTYKYSNLEPNTEYSFSFTPTSTYGVSGDAETFQIATLGQITEFDISINTAGTVTVSVSGNYDITTLKYKNGGETTSISSDISYPYTFAPTDPSMSATYVWVYPINSDGVTGSATDILYIPAVSNLYFSDISTTYVTISLDGTYASNTLQMSTDGGATYTDVSAGITDAEYTLTHSSTTYADTEVYFRATPAAPAGDGMTTAGVYVPKIVNADIGISSLTGNDISLNWTGMHDGIQILYSIDGGSTYSELVDVSYESTDITQSNAYLITTSTLPSLDVTARAYYLKISPYAHGVGGNKSTGITSKAVYTPVITSITAAAASINSITITYDGTYSSGKIYYSTSESFTSATPVNMNLTGETTIYNLLCNTTYYFYIVPYGQYYNYAKVSGVASETISATTNSLLTDLSAAAAASTTSLYISWNDTGYDKIELYNSAGTVVFSGDSSDDKYYDTSGVETLTANTQYIYTFVLYDSLGNSETTTLTTYTLTSFDLISLSSAATTSSAVVFSWTAANYYTISFKNVTLDTNTTTLYLSGGVSTYSSASYENYSGSTYLLRPNTTYEYYLTLTNLDGDSVYKTVYVTTAATLIISKSTAANLTDGTIPVVLAGHYSSAGIYTSTDSGSTYTLNSTITASAAPDSPALYYPFTANYYNYSAGATINSSATTTYNGANISAAQSLFSSYSLYLNSSSQQYISMPKFTTTAGTLTISLWFRASAGTAAIAHLSNSSSTQYVQIKTTASATAAIVWVGGVKTEIDFTDSAGWNTAATWHHVAVTISAAGAVTLYHNGAANTTSTLTTALSAATYSKNYLGTADTTNFFKGYIQEFYVYGSELTATQIENIYKIAYNTTTVSATKYNFTYYIRAEPANSAGTAGATTDSITQLSMAKLTAAAATTIDSSAITITWDGSYSTVDVSGIITADATTTRTDLAANTTYTYRITPINQPFSGADFSGAALDVSATTLPTMTSLAATVQSSTQIDIAWDGSYSKVALWKSTDEATYSQVTTTKDASAAATGLSYNTTYYFKALPYNRVDASGTTYKTVSAKTLAQITNITVGDYGTKTLSLYIDGSYSSYKVKYNTIITDVSTAYPIIISDLTAYTQYTFTVYAYNNTAGTGTATTATTTATTYAGVTNFYYSAVTENSVTLAWDGSFTDLYILSSDGQEYFSNDSTTTFSGLAENTLYSFVATPYDADGAGGDTMTVSVYTLPTATKFTAADISTNYITMSWDGSYDTVDISAGAAGTYTGDASENIFSGLAANTAYSFTLTPLNTSDVSGTPITVDTATAAFTADFRATDVSTNYISLAWDGSYDAVDISAGAAGTYVGTAAENTFSSLAANKDYTFEITPVNVLGASGDTTTITQATMPFAENFKATDSSINYITVTWDGSYSTVDISAGTAGTYTGSATENTFTGLAANTDYTFALTPVGLHGASGDTLTITKETSPFAANFRATDTSTNYITVAWDGSYSTVDISAGEAGTYTGADATNTFSSLISNKTYTFTITPVGLHGVSGDSLAITSATSAFTTNFRATDTSTNYITLSWDGSYSAVDISAGAAGTYTGAESTKTFSSLAANTDYTFTITPINTLSVSGDTTTITNATMPFATNFRTTDASLSYISLAWDGSFTTVDISAGAAGTYDGAATATTFENLTYNKTYTFTITPVGLRGASGDTHTVTKATSAFAANFRATDTSTNYITLSWDGSYSSVDISAGEAGTYYGSAATNTFSGLAASTSYTFALTPINTLGVSGDTIYLTKSTSTGTLNFRATDTSTNYISLAWDGSFTTVYVTGGDAGNYTGSDSYYTFTNLPANTSYVFEVTPIDALGVSGDIQYLTKATSAFVENFGATDFSTNYITLAWDGSYSTVDVSGSAGAGEYIGTDTTATFSSLAANIEYTFTIKPINVLGVSGDTLTITKTTAAFAENFRTTDVSYNYMTLAWDGSFARVDVSGGAAGEYIGTASSATFTNLTTNTSYSYSLTPVNTTGVSGDVLYLTAATAANLTTTTVLL